MANFSYIVHVHPVTLVVHGTSTKLFVQLLSVLAHYLILFTLQENKEKAMLAPYIAELKRHQQQLELIYEHIKCVT